LKRVSGTGYTVANNRWCSSTDTRCLSNELRASVADSFTRGCAQQWSKAALKKLVKAGTDVPRRYTPDCRGWIAVCSVRSMETG
jgi:hypothetical protein